MSLFKAPGWMLQQGARGRGSGRGSGEKQAHKIEGGVAEDMYLVHVHSNLPTPTSILCTRKERTCTGTIK
jgi:hypothetical protein